MAKDASSFSLDAPSVAFATSDGPVAPNFTPIPTAETPIPIPIPVSTPKAKKQALPQTVGELKALLEKDSDLRRRFETALVRKRLFGQWAQEFNHHKLKQLWADLLKETM